MRSDDRVGAELGLKQKHQASTDRASLLYRSAKLGCPSWILIEPCAAPQNPLFGGFWRISGNFGLPPRRQLSSLALGRPL
jgi:hypothetical protein